MANAATAHAVILGAAGYGGGELLRWLLGHPRIASLTAQSRSHAGQPLWKAHPHLRDFTEVPFVGEVDWRCLPGEGPVAVFSAMGHGELAQMLPVLESAWDAAGLQGRIHLIDLSGDFRVRDAEAFAAAYGRPHPHPGLLEDFVYGLPEMPGTALRGARRIANPGCFATAIALGLLPLAGVEDLGFVAVSGMTGSSGSGALAQEGTHHPTRAHDLRAYKVLGHQHEAELQQLMAAQGIGAELAFVPHSAPVVRGIFATLQFQLPASLTPEALRARVTAAFAGRPFVRVVEDTPRLLTVVGTNRAEVAVHVAGRKAAILVALDNLGKGMAGQAVQNLNLALGWPEDTGLRAMALHPG